MYQIIDKETYLILTVDQGFRQFDASERVSGVAQEMNDKVYQGLDEKADRTPVLLDLREFQLSFSELVRALGETRDSESMFNHPNLGAIAVVTENSIIKMAASALSQLQYGQKTVKVFKSVDEAADYLESLS